MNNKNLVTDKEGYAATSGARDLNGVVVAP